jgi:hypothetical protein
LSKNSVFEEAIDSKTKSNNANAPITPIATGIAFFLQALDVKKAPFNGAEDALIA